GTTTAVSPAMRRMLGRDERSLAGRSIFDLLQTEDAVILRQHLGQPDVLQRETDTLLMRPDGSQCVGQRLANPLQDKLGDTPGGLRTSTDVKAQRQVDGALHIYGLAADASPDLISVVDETGHYRMVNDAWCIANRLARKDVLGRHVRQIAPERLIPERRDALVECLIQRHPVSIRAQVDLADRGRTDLEIDYYPFGDDLHQTRHVMMMCRDVTARERVLKAALAADADNRALLEAFPGYIAAIDQDLRYVYVNPATAARLGGTPETIIGRRIDEVLQGETLSNMRRDVEDRFSDPGQPVTIERGYPGKHGLPPVTLQVTRVASPVGVKGEQTFYAFGIDVSDYRRARRDVELLLQLATDVPDAA
ncbi:MAG: PAS domain-containing protein, partial [Rubrivivax sp.]